MASPDSPAPCIRDQVQGRITDLTTYCSKNYTIATIVFQNGGMTSGEFETFRKKWEISQEQASMYLYTDVLLRHSEEKYCQMALEIYNGTYQASTGGASGSSAVLPGPGIGTPTQAKKMSGSLSLQCDDGVNRSDVQINFSTSSVSSPHLDSGLQITAPEASSQSRPVNPFDIANVVKQLAGIVSDSYPGHGRRGQMALDSSSRAAYDDMIDRKQYSGFFTSSRSQMGGQAGCGSVTDSHESSTNRREQDLCNSWAETPGNDIQTSQKSPIAQPGRAHPQPTSNPLRATSPVGNLTGIGPEMNNFAGAGHSDNHSRPVHPENNLPRPVHAASNLPRPVHPVGNHPRSVQPASNLPRPVHPASNLPRPVHPASNHSGSVHAVNNHSGAVHPESNHSGAVHPEINHSGSVRAASSHSGSAHAVDNNSGSVHTVRSHSGAVHPESNHSGAIHPERIHSGAVHASSDPLTTSTARQHRPQSDVASLAAPEEQHPKTDIPTTVAQHSTEQSSEAQQSTRSVPSAQQNATAAAPVANQPPVSTYVNPPLTGKRESPITAAPFHGENLSVGNSVSSLSGNEQGFSYTAEGQEEPAVAGKNGALPMTPSQHTDFNRHLEELLPKSSDFEGRASPGMQSGAQFLNRPAREDLLIIQQYARSVLDQTTELLQRTYPDDAQRSGAARVSSDPASRTMRADHLTQTYSTPSTTQSMGPDEGSQAYSTSSVRDGESTSSHQKKVNVAYSRHLDMPVTQNFSGDETTPPPSFVGFTERIQRWLSDTKQLQSTLLALDSSRSVQALADNSTPEQGLGAGTRPNFDCSPILAAMSSADIDPRSPANRNQGGCTEADISTQSSMESGIGEVFSDSSLGSTSLNLYPCEYTGIAESSDIIIIGSHEPNQHAYDCCGCPMAEEPEVEIKCGFGKDASVLRSIKKGISLHRFCGFRFRCPPLLHYLDSRKDVKVSHRNKVRFHVKYTHGDQSKWKAFERDIISASC